MTDTSASSTLSQDYKNEALALAWSKQEHDEAKAWIALGADPLSDARPLLCEAILNHDIEHALALAPYRWNEPAGFIHGQPADKPLKACLSFIHSNHHANPDQPGAQLLARLLNLGADPNATANRFPQSDSPLFYAVSHHMLHAAGLLIDHGADLFERRHSGETPLHAAVINWDPEMAELLIRRGIDPTLKNNEGLTAEQLVATIPAKKQSVKLAAVFAKLLREELEEATPAALPAKNSLRM